ncbi:MAG: substrate-binding domain-containing protein [Verrucomicrobia bacterium]|nr:substrate-binding domain-containing protein [Verrucomicrobiota bacterium]
MTTPHVLLPLPLRPSLAQHAAQILRDGLVRGWWQERLPGERDLSRQLHVSRPTLRAALDLLAAQGWVASAPRRARTIVKGKRATPRAAAPTVRLLVPFRLQEAPPLLFYWMDKLRALLPAAGCALEIHSGTRYYGRAPERDLARLTRQRPAAAWVLTRATEAMQWWFAAQRLPCVVAGSCYPAVPLPSVDFDYRAVARHAAHRLMARGHRRLALLIQTPELAGDHEAAQGFREACEGRNPAGVSIAVLRHAGTLPDVRRKLDVLLDSSPIPTGFFVLRATSALTVASELTRRGFRLPADMALISRDSDPFLGCFSPEIARYGCDPDLFARRLASMVIRLAHDRKAPRRHVRIIPEFIRGETLG